LSRHIQSSLHIEVEMMSFSYLEDESGEASRIHRGEEAGFFFAVEIFVSKHSIPFIYGSCVDKEHIIVEIGYDSKNGYL